MNVVDRAIGYERGTVRNGSSCRGRHPPQTIAFRLSLKVVEPRPPEEERWRRLSRDRLSRASGEPRVVYSGVVRRNEGQGAASCAARREPKTRAW